MIPIIGKNFEEDQKIISYCKYSNDDKCDCMYPSKSINELLINAYSPYYCWYQPCQDENQYKTSILDSAIKYCNVNICNVTIDEIQVNTNSKVVINNNCVDSIIINDRNIIDKELLEPPINSEYNIPLYFLKSNLLIIAGLLTVLFLN